MWRSLAHTETAALAHELARRLRQQQETTCLLMDVIAMHDAIVIPNMNSVIAELRAQIECLRKRVADGATITLHEIDATMDQLLAVRDAAVRLTETAAAD